MANILIAQRAPEINTGIRVLSPPQLKVGDSSVRIAKEIEGTVKDIFNFKLNLDKKKADLDEMDLRVRHSDDLQKELLDFEKWKQSNNGDDMLPEWQNEAQRRIDFINQSYDQTPMTPETRLKIKERTNNWANNLLADTYAGEIRMKSGNFSSKLDAVKQTAYQTGDFTDYDYLLTESFNKNIFNEQQYNSLKADRDSLLIKRKLQDVDGAVQTFVNGGQYDFAKDELQQAFNEGLISKPELDSQISRIDSQMVYGEKKNSLEIDLQNDPLKYNSLLKTTQTSGQNVDLYSFVKQQEGFTPKAQWDYAQYSVGYGTKGVAGETLTESQASVRLQKELQIHEKRVDEFAAQNNMVLTTNQRNALISYDFNTGKVEGVFSRAKGDSNKLGDAIRNGIKTADGEFLQGLADRREREAKLAETPSKTSTTAVESGLEWLSPNDRRELMLKSEALVLNKAQNEFQTLKQAIDLGQIKDDSDDRPAFKDVPSLSNALSFETYKTLNNSDDVNVRQMRDVLKNYSKIKMGKSMINDSENYLNVLNQINRYSSKDFQDDSSGLGRLAIQTKIENEFDGPTKDFLKSRFEKFSNTVEGKEKSKVLSTALEDLLKKGYDDQAFGVYKKPKQISAEFTTYPGYLGGWLGGWGSKVETGMVELAKENKKVSFKNPKTGEIETFTPTEAQSIFEEDVDKKKLVTDKMNLIQNELENMYDSGLIKTKDDAKKALLEISRNYLSVPQTKPENKLEQARKIKDRYLKE